MTIPDEGTPDWTGQAIWNDVGAALWNEHGDRDEAIDGPAGAAMLRAARLRPGDRVLDVGCGAGTTTVQAAGEVGPTGTVVGVDIAPAMLEFAAARVADAGVTNVELIAADAQTHAFGDGTFDVVISRFGTMFFADPVAAFRNLAHCLRPDGRLAMVVLRAPKDDPWVSTVLDALVPHVGTTGLRRLTESGAYALADGDRLDRILSEAGFHAVERQALTLPVRLGADADDVVGYLLDQPEIEVLMAGKSADQVPGAVAALREALAAHAGPDGVVMDSSTWLVTAQR